MKPIPLPSRGDLTKWALSIVDYLRDVESEITTPGPKIVQLEYRKVGAKATKNGILMWEPVSKQVIVSKDGAWYPLSMGGTPVTTGLDG